jgi:hypothetical protein
MQRVSVANRAAIVYLETHGYGPAKLTLDRLDTRGLVARDVSLRDGTFTAKRVTLAFTPAGLGRNQIDTIAAEGLHLDLAYNDEGISLGGKPLSSGSDESAALGIGRFQFDKAEVTLETSAAHLGGTLSASGSVEARRTKILPKAVVHIVDGFIETSPLRASDVKADAELRPDMSLAVQTLSLSVAGGRLAASPFTVDAAGSAIASTIAVEQVDLAEVLKLIGLDGLSGTGRIDGKIPLKFDDDNVRVDDAALQASGPGVLNYKSDTAPKALASAGEEVAEALHALEDFHYETLSLKVDEESNGAGTVLLALQGANPAVMSGQPFNINIKLESNFDRLADLALEGLGATRTLLRRAERNLPQ